MNRGLIALLLTTAVAGSAMAGSVILEGDSWRFHKGTNTPPLQGPINWTQVEYDDSDWEPSAPSPFGYGNSFDATSPAGMSGSYASIFLRKNFVIADTSHVTRLTLAADYDDGFVAHINGIELKRVNMPEGAIGHASLASSTHEASRSMTDYSHEKEFFSLDKGALLNGTNIIAVSGHNVLLADTDFSMTIELYTNVTLVRGPFVQMPDSNRVVVIWRTDAATDAALEWGADTNFASGTISNTNIVREHIIALTNLAAGSQVFYRVRSAGETLAEDSFRTPAATNQSCRFVAIGDFGAGGSGEAAIAERIAATNFDFLITVGDNIYPYGQPGDYDRHWFKPFAWSMRRSATFPALGNHDGYFSDSHWMADSFVLPTNGPPSMSELVYSYDISDAHFVVIDSNPIANGDAASTEIIRSWLSNDLARTERFWKIVTFHHPPYTSTGAHAENVNMQSNIVPVLEKYKVQVCFQGHNHFYERIAPMHGVNYITCGGGGQSLYGFATTPPLYSSSRYNADFSYVVADIQDRRMDLRAHNSSGSLIDHIVLDYGAPFIVNGALDQHWSRATNATVLFAAIRSNLLYAATQDAGDGYDNFLLVNDHISSNRSAPWAKSGTTMQWGAYLADENDNGFSSWFGPHEEILDDLGIYQAATPGIDANAPNNNGVLEGVLKLDAHFGSFPTQLLFCVAPYSTADGGALYAPWQCPVNNGDGNITSNEFFAISTRALALDLPIASAGTGQTNEAGLVINLDGSSSTSPSGYALSYSWTQTAGPRGVFANSNSISPQFHLTNDIATATSVIFKLSVNDARFDSTSSVTIVFVPRHDSDGDGLSDGEEATGRDNALTTPDPGGHTSSTNIADSDNDGFSDGAEALVGTDPQNALSFFAIAGVDPSGAGAVVRWPAASNRSYTLLGSTNLLAPPFVVRSNLPATPPANVFTTSPGGALIFRVRLAP